jgi:hypothetical protein
MAEFRRIRIRATVETPGMLLGGDQIESALDELLDKLEALDLSVLSLEPVEPPPPSGCESAEGDPWTFRGHAVE